MITGNLEYLLSSLPDLSFQHDGDVRQRVEFILRKYAGQLGGHKDLVSLFMDEAIKFIPEKVAELLNRINLQSIHESQFRGNRLNLLSEFSDFMYAFKSSLCAYRIARRKASVQNTQMESTFPIQPGTPLEEEVQLLQMQWDKLDDLAAGHHYDHEALIIYKLKLQILQRWWSFDQEKGMKIFSTLTQKH